MLIPLSWPLLQRSDKKNWQWFGLLLALLLSLAYKLEAGWLAGLLSAPWIFFSLRLQLLIWQQKDHSHYHRFASLYLTIGAVWCLADRANVQPIGFEPIIVLLSAAHFHYAGFLLLLITCYLLKEDKNSYAKISGSLVLAGVPLVAIGITLSQFGSPLYIESVAASIMAFGGMGVATAYTLKIRKKNFFPIGLCHLVGGLCLFIGMILALLYAWRAQSLFPFLTIPWMYSVHGTLNVLGTGLLVFSIFIDKKN